MSPDSPNILIIEDNTEMRHNIEEILKLAHYNVLSAPNGKQGVELAFAHKPDLILCDIMMPDLDGYSVLHILSKSPEAGNIPFIFLTAKAEKEDFRAGMNLGADDYITKPFEGLDLLRVVEVRLKKQETARINTQRLLASDLSAMFRQVQHVKSFEKLIAESPVRTYKKKQTLYLEGDQAHTLYLIKKGEVKIYLSNKEGKELITSLAGEGDFFGFTSLLNDTSYTESAAARSELLYVHAISKKSFLELIYGNQEIARYFLHILARLLSERQASMLHLAYQSVRQKVAGALLYLHNQQLAVHNHDNHIISSRKDISCLVGTATETLNRTLLDFKEEKLIEIDDEGLKILDLNKLRQLNA
jgi:CheY-like chemotaxis protein